MTDAVVYKLYSLRPLSTAANQQLAVSTGTIATYFGNLAPPCGCLHAVVHELCVRAPIGAIGPKGLNSLLKLATPTDTLYWPVLRWILPVQPHAGTTHQGLP